MLVKLGTVLKVQHGYAFKSESYVKKSHYRLVTLGNFSENNTFKYNNSKAIYYGADFPKEFILQENDLILPLTEQVEGLFGNTALVPCSTNYKFVLNQRVGKIICNESKVNKLYLHYLLASESVKKQLEARASGTRQRNISPENIYDVTVDLPNIELQIKIGLMLKKIENQIESNNTIVKRLQVLSHTIYKQWFIQFEHPNSNRNLVYNTELKRKIPIGWKVVSLYDLMHKLNLTADQTINSPTIDLSVMPSSNISLINLNSSDKFSTDLNKMKEGNILFGSIRPYLKKCGVAPCDGKVTGTVYQFEVHQPEAYNYILMTMSQDFFFDYALKVSTGTRMPVVSADEILSYKLPYNENIVHLFNKLPIKKLILSINKNTNKLIKLKDKLLPLLINGQLE